MFINAKSGYDKGDQVAKGDFLVAFTAPGETGGELRCAIRTVKLRQLGHWMMGNVRLGGVGFTLSGGFGSDGLPMNLDSPSQGLKRDQKEGLWEQLIPMPQELADRYWKSDGHNSVGPVAPDIIKWAMENRSSLRKTIHKVI